MHQIIVNVKVDGSAEVKAEGYQGPSCSLKTKPFIDALGDRISDTPTAEMFQETTTQQEVEQ